MSMTSFNKSVKGLIALLFGMMVSVSVAHAADEPVILIVDQAKILATSKAGASVGDQMKNLQDAANKFLEAESNRLVKEAEELTAKKAKMDEAKFLEQARALNTQRNQLPVLRELKAREITLTEQKSYQAILKELDPILKGIVDKKGATLLLDRASVMYAAGSTDITDEVIKKLDAKLSTYKVEPVVLLKKKEK